MKNLLTADYLNKLKDTTLEDLPDEIWKPIVGYEGSYEVSNYGRVKSLHRFVKRRHRNGKICKHPVNERILKPQLRKRGYYGVSLSSDKKVKNFKIHRLIAIHFIDKIEGKEHINHINGCKVDNRLENLEWCTNQENIVHSYKYLNRKTKKGKDNDKRGKNTSKYDLDGNFIERFPSARKAADSVGGLTTQIAICARGGQKTAYGFIWKYDTIGR